MHSRPFFIFRIAVRQGENRRFDDLFTEGEQ